MLKASHILIALLLIYVAHTEYGRQQDSLSHEQYLHKVTELAEKFERHQVVEFKFKVAIAQSIADGEYDAANEALHKEISDVLPMARDHLKNCNSNCAFDQLALSISIAESMVKSSERL